MTVSIKSRQRWVRHPTSGSKARHQDTKKCWDQMLHLRPPVDKKAGYLGTEVPRCLLQRSRVKNTTVDQKLGTQITLLEKSHLWIKGCAPGYKRKCWDQLIKGGAPGHQSVELPATKVEVEKMSPDTHIVLLEKPHLWIKGWAPGYKSVGMSGGAHAVDEGLLPHPLMDHHACSINPSPSFKLVYHIKFT
jgi:hypothetical protein